MVTVSGVCPTVVSAQAKNLVAASLSHVLLSIVSCAGRLAVLAASLIRRARMFDGHRERFGTP